MKKYMLCIVINFLISSCAIRSMNEENTKGDENMNIFQLFFSHNQQSSLYPIPSGIPYRKDLTNHKKKRIRSARKAQHIKGCYDIYATQNELARNEIDQEKINFVNRKTVQISDFIQDVHKKLTIQDQSAILPTTHEYSGAFVYYDAVVVSARQELLLSVKYQKNVLDWIEQGFMIPVDNYNDYEHQDNHGLQELQQNFNDVQSLMQQRNLAMVYLNQIYSKNNSIPLNISFAICKLKEHCIFDEKLSDAWFINPTIPMKRGISQTKNTITIPEVISKAMEYIHEDNKNLKMMTEELHNYKNNQSIT